MKLVPHIKGTSFERLHGMIPHWFKGFSEFAKVCGIGEKVVDYVTIGLVANVFGPAWEAVPVGFSVARSIPDGPAKCFR
jgi:hypothetical protein